MAQLALVPSLRQFSQSPNIYRDLGARKEVLVNTYEDGDNYICTNVIRKDKYSDPLTSGMYIPKSRVAAIWEIIRGWPVPNNPLVKESSDIPDNCKIRAKQLQKYIIMTFQLDVSVRNFTARENRNLYEYPYYHHPLYILQNLDAFRKGSISWRLK